MNIQYILRALHTLTCTLICMLRDNGARSREGIGTMVRILATQRRGIGVCHINAQSLGPKIDEFRFIFENSGVDVVCVSETWFKPDLANPPIHLQGYNISRADRNGYGGVAIYVRKGIATKVICKSEHNVETDNNGNAMEYIFLEMCYEGRKLLMGCIYRPNNRVSMRGFMDILQTLSVSYEDVIIAGDFNSNILVDSYLIDSMLTLGLNSPNTVYATHFTRTNNTLLDLFFVSDLSKVLLYDQLSASCFSHHDLIFLKYNFRVNLPERIIRYRDFRNINYGMLGEEFSNINWNLVYSQISVDDQLSFLQQNIDHLYNLTVPLRTKIVNHRDKPWFNRDIKHAIEQRDRSFARWKRFRTTELYDEYRTLRRMANRLIKRAKSDYYASKFSTAIGSRQTWRTIREIGIGGISNEEPCALDANALIERFMDTPNVHPTSDYYNFCGNGPNNNFRFVGVTQCDVLPCIMSIKSNAIGVDEMDPRFLRILAPQLLPYIIFIFNKIFTTNCYPKMWKIAKIIPIPKSNSDYRPIAILPFLSKVFEKLVHMQVAQFLRDNSLLTDRQSGFRKNNSCITALVDVAEDIRQQIDIGNVTFLTLLDHSRAFDTVDHRVLINKLKYMFGFESTATDLIKSYLVDRYQYVQTLTAKSRCLPLSQGVPQGSILGPLLFSLYINDLHTRLQHCKVRLYADDVQLYMSCNPGAVERCARTLNQELERVNKWATANGLQINPAKSKCIIIGKRLLKLDYRPILKLNNQSIEIVQSAKNLGIFFNNTLTWSNHISMVCGRAFSMLRNLWQTQYCTPIRIRKLLAKAYLIPTLLYGCELFASCDVESKRRLNVAFNNIVRYVYGLRRHHHISTYVTLFCGMNFNNYLIVRTLQFLHKIIYTHQPQHLYERLNFSAIGRGRRLLAFRHRTLISQYHFFVHAIRLWNSVPYEFQMISNAHRFRKCIVCYFSQIN